MAKAAGVSCNHHLDWCNCLSKVTTSTLGDCSKHQIRARTRTYAKSWPPECVSSCSYTHSKNGKDTTFDKMMLRAGVYLDAILPFESPSLLHTQTRRSVVPPPPNPQAMPRQCHSNLDEDSCWRLSRRLRQPHLPLYFERFAVFSFCHRI